MKSKFLAVLCIILTAAIVGNAIPAYAAEPKEIKVTVDGNPVTFDQKPQIINGNVMIPIEAVAEMMGWEVRQNSPMVIQLAKAVKYTDGTRNYLFSSHTTTLDLEKEWLSRSIMIGIGKFLDTAADKKIAFTLNPVIVNGSTLVHMNDIGKCLYATAEWNAATQTVSIKSGEIPYYDGQGLENREELFEQMRTYNKVSGTLTKIDEQISQSTETAKPQIATLFQPAGVMVKAPEVGSKPAKILMPGKTDMNSIDSYYEPYKTYNGRGCNWYAFSRFYEIYGYRNPVPYTSTAYLDKVEEAETTLVRAERDLNKIESGCIAVYWRKNVGSHVVFVEYVERDVNGNPVNIYYTECMNTNDSGYKPATDGKVKKVTFERFKKSSSGTKDLMGYIVTQN